jgi:hypothetical protein
MYTSQIDIILHKGRESNISYKVQNEGLHPLNASDHCLLTAKFHVKLKNTISYLNVLCYFFYLASIRRTLVLMFLKPLLSLYSIFLYLQVLWLLLCHSLVYQHFPPDVKCQRFPLPSITTMVYTCIHHKLTLFYTRAEKVI